jgi:hypothetical protein
MRCSASPGLSLTSFHHPHLCLHSCNFPRPPPPTSQPPNPSPALLPQLASAFTVTVGAKRSSARYFLNNVDEVHGLLSELVRAPDTPYVTPSLPARSPAMLSPQND